MDVIRYFISSTTLHEKIYITNAVICLFSDYMYNKNNLLFLL